MFVWSKCMLTSITHQCFLFDIKVKTKRKKNRKWRKSVTYSSIWNQVDNAWAWNSGVHILFQHQLCISIFFFHNIHDYSSKFTYIKMLHTITNKIQKLLYSSFHSSTKKLQMKKRMFFKQDKNLWSQWGKSIWKSLWEWFLTHIYLTLKQNYFLSFIFDP